MKSVFKVFFITILAIYTAETYADVVHATRDDIGGPRVVSPDNVELEELSETQPDVTTETK
ncbi:hypothetical protein [Aquibacillus kalidii]|uniref:hypothetical protein n=1 Tax=Aquibacillus kalidii TaxID=2762597 RepID=UPI0016474043|nr:hypothetical protein [Aquibacillus kalidii]